ncbi:ABC transporter ATP-binding protein [Chloroflexota bacterium]
MTEMLLEIQNLKKYFPITKGVFLKKVLGSVKAVDEVSLSVARGESFGLVGESGCGKTTISRLILILEKPTEGCILFEGKDIQRLTKEGLCEFRAAVQPVFQDPYSSLNPRMTIGQIVGEPLMVTKTVSKQQVRERVRELLDVVGLRADSDQNYPHEFSGGQRQRIAIARALVASPRLVILDEPVSALDLSIRAQLMNLLKDLQSKLGLTYFLIAHDLAVIRHMSSRIGVMYLGKMVESAENDELYQHPLHPYTKMLLAAALPLRPDSHVQKIPIEGEVPSPLDPPSGCHFHTRCPFAKEICSEVEPPLTNLSSAHQVACHLCT